MTVALLPLFVFAASQIGTPGPANMALLATGARFGFKEELKATILGSRSFTLITFIQNRVLWFTDTSKLRFWDSGTLTSIFDIKNQSLGPPEVF